LEDPNVPKEYFPLRVFGIYDRVTVEKNKLDRLKEDIIKILSETEKFGIFVDANDNDMLDTAEIESNDVLWFTDKMYCPDCNVTYPEFTAQHFSPNRAE
jgi:excinuclease UvrABC ATPase subunit